MRSFHANWFWVATSVTGVVGLWGLGLAIAKRGMDRNFLIARAAAFVVMSIQIAAGLVLWGIGERPGNGFHVFYGILIVVTFSFAYLYRSAMNQRPALAYGLLLLFAMGLGLRAWSNVTL